MKIVVLERIDMTTDQKKRLAALGELSFFENSTEQQCVERIRDADVVVVDWVDPSSFILSMRTPSLVALMSTGYAWVQHRDLARRRGTLISNIPGYATEAVAEHIVGLTISVARRIMAGDRRLRSGDTAKGGLRGVEMSGRCMGIIGLGRIGQRVAAISQCLGMRVVTYNRHPKACEGIRDVALDELLGSADVVCVTCPLNEESRGMLDAARLRLLMRTSILVGTTWGVVDIEALLPALEEGRIAGAGFDVAVEGGAIDLPSRLLKLDNVVLTPHIAFDTEESKARQVSICIENIAAFVQGRPVNIVN